MLLALLCAFVRSVAGNNAVPGKTMVVLSPAEELRFTDTSLAPRLPREVEEMLLDDAPCRATFAVRASSGAAAEVPATRVVLPV
jgi:hypothetical protein